MRFRRSGIVKDLRCLGLQEFGVLRIDDEPPQFWRKRLDHVDVGDQAVDEYGFRHSVVARYGGMRDEIPRFEAFLQR